MAARKTPPDAEAKKARPVGLSLRDQLKALPVAEPAAPAKPVQAPRQRPAQPADSLSFKQLAAGVAPLPGSARALGQRPSPAASAATPRAAAEPPKKKLWVERRGAIVLARAEDVPARVLDELASGRLVPRRQIDLHRLSAVDARQLLDAGIRQARRQGLGCVLVVCGRGLHSGADGPVLPDVAIERLSEELQGEVLAFATAPRKWGGEGALIVRLRAAPTE
jgi:DNA-nicking Smr family endonuclease